MSSQQLIRVALVFLASSLPAIAWGWGKEGHRIVARIAVDNLSDKARQGIAMLIPGQQIHDTDVALWADSFNQARWQRDASAQSKSECLQT